ncbi:MAG: Thymidylate synthase complementing protein ThyX [Candidatus Gottesmanbacteria bacterium GW2011_GWB1_49_7]|uniref:FAD-dependent thymidylate synthase n=1 Tax=Candidatus Gottesmanbacteria bacterium GW2011_GWB1_49_7 TaxID=1618448 RepID=A0A0G1YE28_9BACT|nr:MAG: Thymidylate synthase complementing protein ThyX [Candidatus Gottesmanbacteria bacterium GW2011_GWB1_49_7]
MHNVTPKVYLIAKPAVIEDGLAAYLSHIGASAWKTDAAEGERLIEIMARGCYRSFGAGLNPNVTKVREGIADYLANILKVKHESVLEHACYSFMFCDVSRVFTHELVRHRVGCAISQESLRYVRLEDLGQWLPDCIRDDPEMVDLFKDTFEHLEKLQKQMAEHFGLDDPGKPFAKKKEVTSAMRRIAPIGLATNIGWSANIRTLRHVIAMRTSLAAEEEIRLVFDEVAQIMQQEAPHAFGDFKRSDDGEWTTE